MVKTKERASGDIETLSVDQLPGSASSPVEAMVTPDVSRHRQIGHFVAHYFEMCLPMCIGFAIGDLVYFWAAGRFGYSRPFRQLPSAGSQSCRRRIWPCGSTA